MTQQITPPPTILVGNRTGGQGKTLIAQLLHYGFGLSQHDMKVVTADSSDKSGDASKLGQILKNQGVKVEELGIGARMESIKADPKQAVAYWDKIGGHLKGGSTIIDLGANILPMIFDWADQRKARRVLEHSKIHLVVPVTAQRQSLNDAVQMIKLSLAAADCQIPFTERFVVYNSYHGPFKDLARSPEMDALLRFQDANQIKCVDLARCASEVWDQVELNFTPLSKLAALDHVGYQSAFGLDEFAASGAHVDFVGWLDSTMAAFRKVGLVPPDSAGLDKGSLKPAA